MARCRMYMGTIPEIWSISDDEAVRGRARALLLATALPRGVRGRTSWKHGEKASVRGIGRAVAAEQGRITGDMADGR